MTFWPWIAAWYAAASAATWLAYWRDKRAAVRGRRRTRERTLHMLEFAGGWPGAFLAQQMLRHKTRHLRFQLTAVAIAAAHLFAWALWLWCQGR